MSINTKTFKMGWPRSWTLSNAKQTQEEFLNQQGCSKILYNAQATFRSWLFMIWLHRAWNLSVRMRHLMR